MNTIYNNSEAYCAQFLQDSQYINQIFQDERNRLFFWEEETAVSAALLFIFPKQGNRMALVLHRVWSTAVDWCNLCSTPFNGLDLTFFLIYL